MKTILVDAAHTFVSNTGEIFEEMHQLLEIYPNKKIILSSANAEQFKIYNLGKMPYEVFTLQHNPEKTDPKYYETVLQHFNLTKDNVIYFEHDKDAVQSAQSVGIETYLYDESKKDLDALKKFLDAHLK